MNKLFLKISTTAVLFFLKSGIARFWYKLYQFLWERNKLAELKRFPDIEDLVNYVRGLKWRADTWRELGDAVSSAEAVQWRANNDPRALIGDCDEFGVYIAAVFNNELAKVSNWSGDIGFERGDLLTVMWYKTGGKEWEGNRNGFGGHNVCLISYKDGGYSYMDYGWPSIKRATIQEVVEDVRLRYAQVYQPIGWAVSDPVTLKVKQTGA
jgi:hypothetical protein